MQMHLTKLAASAAFVTVALVPAAAPGAQLEAADNHSRHVPSCKHEDSTDCYWDAATRGNRMGTSFLNIGGHIWSEVAR